MRDVVAHVLSYEELGPRQLAGRFARGALRTALFAPTLLGVLRVRDVRW